MTKTNMDLSELPAKHDQGDLLRNIAEAVLQLIMEADVDSLIGAGRHERSGDRTTCATGMRGGAALGRRTGGRAAGGIFRRSGGSVPALPLPPDRGDGQGA
ncbi:MAG: transposase [Cereibacter changlensis]